LRNHYVLNEVQGFLGLSVTKKEEKEKEPGLACKRLRLTD
jgi:hypothetical protein